MGLGISWQGLLGQIINFGLLLILLYFIAYKPILRMLDERSRRIKVSMDQAEEIKVKMAETEERVREQLEAARKEGQNIVAQAGQMAERVKEEGRLEARREAESIMARARVEIDSERDQAIEDLRRQFAELAILAAEKVISETLDKERHRRLIDEVLEEGPKGRG